MDEGLSWLQRLPFSALLIVFAAPLALSFLSAPLLMIADRRRSHRTMSLGDRWTLYSWLHPFWAAVWKWTVFTTVAVLIVWGLSSTLWQSHWPAALHDAVLDLVRRFEKTT